jgi:hypothetical protein
VAYRKITDSWNSDWQKKQRQAEKEIRQALDGHEMTSQRIVTEALGKLQFNPDGRLIDNLHNRALRIDLERKLDAHTQAFIDRNIADQVYLDAFYANNPNLIPPGTLFGDAAQMAAEFGRVTAGLAQLDERWILADRLNTAVTDIKNRGEDHKGQVLNAITSSISRGVTYQDIFDAVQGAGVPEKHVYTVTHGVLMQTFRQSQVEAANMIYDDKTPMEDRWFRHEGPLPIPMPNGHEFCIAHYGKVRTLKEWQELARPFEGRSGLNSNRLLDWCGGYGCRHELTVVDPFDVPEYQERAKSDRAEYVASWESRIADMDREGVPFDAEIAPKLQEA